MHGGACLWRISNSVPIHGSRIHRKRILSPFLPECLRSCEETGPITARENDGPDRAVGGDVLRWIPR